MPADPPSFPRARRWFSLRFGLRSLLLFTCLVAVVLGRWTYLARRQQQAVAWVESLGGRVKYENEFMLSDGLLLPLEQTDRPAWRYLPVPESAKAWLGRDFEWRVIGVDLARTHATSLDRVEAFSHLADLDASHTSVSDLSPLARLSGLQRLNLDSTRVEDLSPLAGLRQLAVVELNDTRVADLRPLSGLASLRYLSIFRTQVADLAPLEGCARLESLILAETRVSNLQPIVAARELTHLSASRTPLRDLSPIASLTKLERLYLDGTEVTDLAPLIPLPSLQKIHLEESKVPLSNLAEFIRESRSIDMEIGSYFPFDNGAEKKEESAAREMLEIFVVAHRDRLVAALKTLDSVLPPSLQRELAVGDFIDCEDPLMNETRVASLRDRLQKVFIQSGLPESEYPEPLLPLMNLSYRYELYLESYLTQSRRDGSD